MMIEQIVQIPPQEFADQGIKVILSDLDNTLIPWNQKQQQSQELVQWLEQLTAQGTEVVIASNNSQDRVQKALVDLPVKIVARAKKPLPFELKKYLQANQIDPQTAVMVGDQLLTDVMAGNLAGLKTILVRPLVDTDAKKTRINRIFERPILKINQWLHPKLKWRKHLHE